MTKIIVCKFEDWDDTTDPHLCRCSKYDGVDCANVPDDITTCPDFEPPDEDDVPYIGYDNEFDDPRIRHQGV